MIITRRVDHHVSRGQLPRGDEDVGLRPSGTLGSDRQVVRKAEVKAALDDLVVDSPRTKLAASRVKRLLAKAGGELPGMFREVVVSIASDAAKKAFLGG